MGYYTEYELKVENTDIDLIDKLREENSEARLALTMRGGCQGSIKWYGWKEDLTEFSKLYPKAIFNLSGEGEDNGDIWKAKIVNGNVQIRKANIVFEPFDDGCNTMIKDE